MFGKIKNEINTEVAVMNIGNNIAALRKEKGITQEELANILGVSAQAVSKWENNSSCPDVALLTDIADYFGVTVDALLRAQGDEITSAKPQVNTSSQAQNNFTKNVSIKIVQQNGKTNNIKIPFKFAKIGLNIGNIFGLDKEIADKIGALINGESIGELVDIFTENGEHITITLE